MRSLLKKFYLEYDGYFFPANFAQNFLTDSEEYSQLFYQINALNVLRILVKFKITRQLMIWDYYLYNAVIKRIFKESLLILYIILKKLYDSKLDVELYKYYNRFENFYFYILSRIRLKMYFTHPERFEYPGKKHLEKHKEYFFYPFLNEFRKGHKFEHRRKYPDLYYDYLRASFSKEYLKKYIMYMDDLIYEQTTCEYHSSNQCQNERYKVGRPMYFKYAKEFLYILDHFLLGSLAIANTDLKLKNKDHIKARKPGTYDEYHSLTDYVIEKKIKEPFYNKLHNIKIKIKVNIMTLLFLPALFLLALLKFIINIYPKLKNNLVINQIILHNGFFFGLKHSIIIYINNNWLVWKLKYPFIKDLDLTIQRYYYCKKVYEENGAFYCSKIDNTFFHIELIKLRIRATIETLKSPLLGAVGESYLIMLITFYYYMLDINFNHIHWLKLNFIFIFPIFLNIFIKMHNALPHDADPRDYEYQDTVPYYHNPQLDIPYSMYEEETLNVQDYIYPEGTGRGFFYGEHDHNEAYLLFLDEMLMKKPMRALHRENNFTLSEGERVREAAHFIGIFTPRIPIHERDWLRKNATPLFRKNLNDIFLEEITENFVVGSIQPIASVCETYTPSVMFDVNVTLHITHFSGYEYTRHVDISKKMGPILELIQSSRYNGPQSFFDRRADHSLQVRDPRYLWQDEKIYMEDHEVLIEYKKEKYPKELKTRRDKFVLKATKKQLAKQYFRFYGYDFFRSEEDFVDEMEYIERLFPMTSHLDFAYIGEYDGDIEYEDPDEPTTYYEYQRSVFRFNTRAFNYNTDGRGHVVLNRTNHIFYDWNRDQIYSQYNYMKSENEAFNAPKYIFQILPIYHRYSLAYEDITCLRQSSHLRHWLRTYKRYVNKDYVYIRFFRLKYPVTQYLIPIKYGSVILKSNNRTYDANATAIYPVFDIIINTAFFAAAIHPRLRLNATLKRRRYTKKVYHQRFYTFLDEYEKKLKRRAMLIDPLKAIYPKLKNIKMNSINFLCSRKNYYELLYEEFKDSFYNHLLGFYSILAILLIYFLIFKFYVTIQDNIPSFVNITNNETIYIYGAIDPCSSFFFNNEIIKGGHLYQGYLDYILPKLIKARDIIFAHYLEHWNDEVHLEELKVQLIIGWEFIYKNVDGWHYNEHEGGVSAIIVDELDEPDVQPFNPFDKQNNGPHVHFAYLEGDLMSQNHTRYDEMPTAIQEAFIQNLRAHKPIFPRLIFDYPPTHRIKEYPWGLGESFLSSQQEVLEKNDLEHLIDKNQKNSVTKKLISPFGNPKDDVYLV